jgi:hypothetical protein
MWIAVFFGTLAAIIVDIIFDSVLKLIFVDKILAGYIFKTVRVLVALIIFITVINYVKNFN